MVFVNSVLSNITTRYTGDESCFMKMFSSQEAVVVKVEHA